MRRREGDGCPVAGLLQLIGDKWTMLVVRDLARGGRRTTELLARLHPISSRTLVGRLRDMERDELLERTDFGGSPPRVEYRLTERGQKLLPLIDHLRSVGESLNCNDCRDHKERTGNYCDACPRRAEHRAVGQTARRIEEDNSIVLL